MVALELRVRWLACRLDGPRVRWIRGWLAACPFKTRGGRLGGAPGRFEQCPRKAARGSDNGDILPQPPRTRAEDNGRRHMHRSPRSKRQLHASGNSGRTQRHANAEQHSRTCAREPTRSIKRQGAPRCDRPPRAALRCLARCKREAATFTVPPWHAMPRIPRSLATSVKPMKQHGDDVRPKQCFDCKMTRALFSMFTAFARELLKPPLRAPSGFCRDNHHAHARAPRSLRAAPHL